MSDPAFVDEVRKVHGEVEPMTGEQMQELIGELDTLPPAALDRVKALYKE